MGSDPIEEGKSERREVLRTHIIEMAKRIYGAPEFFYYALADGIQKLFTRFGKWNAKLDLNAREASVLGQCRNNVRRRGRRRNECSRNRLTHCG